MNEDWRVRQTCTALGAAQVSGVCRALQVTRERVLADKSVSTDERAFLARLLGGSGARMAQAVEVLDDATAARDAGDDGERSAATALAAYRDPWRLLRDGLKLAVRTEKVSVESGAAALYTEVFRDKTAMDFLAGAPFEVWTNASKALDGLRGEGARVVLERHHLTGHLDRLEGAHQHFGRAIGATGSLVPVAAAERPTVREALDACTAALCDYVTRACAIEEPDAPGSDALLSRLLVALESVARVPERAAKQVTPAAPDNDAAAPATPRKVG